MSSLICDECIKKVCCDRRRHYARSATLNFQIDKTVSIVLERERERAHVCVDERERERLNARCDVCVCDVVVDVVVAEQKRYVGT